MSKEAIEHYEAALKEAFPSGATGNVFHHWNEARKALAEQPAQGCEFCSHPLYAGTKCKNCGREHPAQQEPVHEFAYKAITKHGHHCHFGTHEAARSWAGEGGEVETIKLRHFELVKTTDTSPQPAQQEPVAWRVKVETKLRDGSVDFGYQLRNERLSKYDEPLYTSPQAQRTWVGLTDEQWQSIADTLGCIITRGQKDAIEAKLREKNQ